MKKSLKQLAAPYSKLGLILVSVYIATGLYLVIDGLVCNSGFFGCGRLLFLLTIPAYLPIAVVFTGTSLALYLFALAIASTIYTSVLYTLGGWIEKQNFYNKIPRANWFNFKKV